MSFGMKVNDDMSVEAIRSDTYIKFSFSHGDHAPGETIITFPSHILPALITSLRGVAASIGQPVKASYDADFLKAISDHEGIGRPVTPSIRLPLRMQRQPAS